MEATAVPIGLPGNRYPATAVGAGLLDANAAVAALILPPSVRILTPPPALSNTTRPSIAFSANRRVVFTCALDGGAAAACESPFVPAAPLADGAHTFTVTGTDPAGHAASASARFTVDTTAPVTKFTESPRGVVKTSKGSVVVGFRLDSSEAGANFQCKVDGGSLRPCGAAFSKRFKVGKHVVSALATDAAGNVGKPATARFRVVRTGRKHHKHHRRHHRHRRHR